MAENSKIEWTDHTFNPWIGCTKVSPGCAKCYAAAQNKLRKWVGGGEWNGPRKRTSEANWKQPRRWNAEAAGIAFAVCPKCGWQGRYKDVCPTPDCHTLGQEMRRRNARVFCASLADWLDDEVPIEWLADLLQLIHDTPNLDWLLLTKRPENWELRLSRLGETINSIGLNWCDEWLNGTAPPNVWIGATMEDQPRRNERFEHLLNIPAVVRFASVEPMLGPVDLRGIHRDLLGWVIIGGESGPGHRELNLKAAEATAEQVIAAGIKLFVKQDSGPQPGKQGRIPDHLWKRKEFPVLVS